MKRIGPRMAFNIITWEIFAIGVIGTGILRLWWDHPVVHAVALFGTAGLVCWLQVKWWSTYSSRKAADDSDQEKFLQGLRDAERGTNIQALKHIESGLNSGRLTTGGALVRYRSGKIVGIEWQ